MKSPCFVGSGRSGLGLSWPRWDAPGASRTGRLRPGGPGAPQGGSFCGAAGQRWLRPQSERLWRADELGGKVISTPDEATLVDQFRGFPWNLALEWYHPNWRAQGFINLGFTIVASFCANLLFCSAWSYFVFAAAEFLDSPGMEVPFDSDVSLRLPDFIAVIYIYIYIYICIYIYKGMI